MLNKTEIKMDSQEKVFKWTDANTADLIVWRVSNNSLFTGRRNAAIHAYELYLNEKQLQGKVTPAWVRKKWENLKQKYKDLKSLNVLEGDPAITNWKWFSIMDGALNSDAPITHIITPVHVTSSAQDAPPPKRRKEGDFLKALRKMEKTQEEQEKQTAEQEDERDRRSVERETERDRRAEEREAERDRRAEERETERDRWATERETERDRRAMEREAERDRRSEEREDTREKLALERQTRREQEMVVRQERWEKEMLAREERQERDYREREERREREAAVREERLFKLLETFLANK